MRTIMCIIGVLFFSLGTFGNDTTSTRSDDYQKLAQKLDSLNGKIEKLLMERERSTSKETEKIKVIDTKKGWGIRSNLSLKEPRLEVGYTFKSHQNFRFGTYFGGEFNNFKYHPDHLLYLKELFGSPVFLNFLGFSTNISLLMLPHTIYRIDDGKGTPVFVTLGRLGVRAGMDMEFWFTSRACFTIGSNLSFIFKSDHNLYSRNFESPEFGLRIQF